MLFLLIVLSALIWQPEKSCSNLVTNIDQDEKRFGLTGSADNDATCKVATLEHFSRAVDPEACWTFGQEGESSELSWDQAVVVGDYMSGLLTSGRCDEDDWCTAQSKWTQSSQLEDNGWTVEKDFFNDFAWQANRVPSRKQLYESLDVSLEEQDNRSLYFRQSREVTIDGEQYEATNAYYKNIYNPRAIVAQVSRSPASKMKQIVLNWKSSQPDERPPPCHHLIPLRHWSDVTFLAFQQNCRDRSKKAQQQNQDQVFGECMGGLRVIVRSEVTNPVTESWVKRILQKTTGSVAYQQYKDARKYSVQDSDEGKILLQTPNGAGVVWLLAQHKVQLGHKVVTDVVIYSCDMTEEEMCVAFLLGDGGSQEMFVS